MDVIETPLGFAHVIADADRSLVDGGRCDVAPHFRAEARDVRRGPRRATVAAVCIEPIPQDWQRLIGGQIGSTPGVDWRALIEPTEARLSAACRPCVHQRRADTGDVSRETEIRHPSSVTLQIPRDTEARTPLRVFDNLRAALILGAVEIHSRTNVERQSRAV